MLLEELVDNQAAQVWLQQEGAFHLGMAVGLKLAEAGYRIPEDDEPVDRDELEIEDALRFGGQSRTTTAEESVICAVEIVIRDRDRCRIGRHTSGNEPHSTMDSVTASSRTG